MFFSTTSSTKCRLFIEPPRKCFGSQPDLTSKASKFFELVVSRLFDPCKLSLNDCCVCASEIKQLLWLLLREITESGHPLGTFFSKASKKVLFAIKLNRHFAFCLSCAQTSMISCLLTLFSLVVNSALIQSSRDLSKGVFFS